MSTAANVLYTWIPHPPDGAPASWTPPADWTPDLTAQVGAAVWPLALLISVEVLSRVRWAPGWQWAIARYGGAGVVALGSATISYGHLHGVLEAWSYGSVGSAVGPLVLDGLMTVCGFALLSPAASSAAVGQGGRRDASRTVERDAQDSRQGAVSGAPTPVLERPAEASPATATAVLGRPVGPSCAGQNQDEAQDASQDDGVNTETDPLRWAVRELRAGRSAGYVVLGRQFPDLSERKAKEVAREARREQDAVLHLVNGAQDRTG